MTRTTEALKELDQLHELAPISDINKVRKFISTTTVCESMSICDYVDMCIDLCR